MSDPASELVRPSRHLRAVAGTAVAVVVALAGAGGFLVLRAFHGSADSVVSMVPGDTALYVTVNLDPPAGQKLAVAGLLNKIPALNDHLRATTVNGWLDKAFSGTGLTHNDVSPWLGSTLSVAVPASAVASLSRSVGGGASSSPDLAFLIASADDGKAQAALDKLRTGPAGRGDTWTTSVHGGTTVTSGTEHNAAGAYALTNHTVIVATSTAAVDRIIDTAQGKQANLQSSSSYTTVESQLPADRLGLIYVDVPAFVKQLGSSIGSTAAGQAQLSAVRAYKGVGIALVASSAGIALDGTEDYDPSKLTSDQRTQLATAPHTNGSLAYVPRTAFGLMAVTGLQQTLSTVLKTVAPTGSAIDTTLQQYGVTGPGGILGHLSGDAGIEVDQLPGQTVPAGTLLFDTDSSAAAQSFLDGLMASVCKQSGACDPSQVTTQVDQGVTISSMPFPAGGSGVEPSWAVSRGWAIVGSSSAEVRAVLDSNATGSTISTSATYKALSTEMVTANNGMIYIDIPAVLRAVHNVLPAADRASYDSSAAPYLSHLGAVELSMRNAPDHLTFTVFVQIR